MSSCEISRSKLLAGNLASRYGSLLRSVPGKASISRSNSAAYGSFSIFAFASGAENIAGDDSRDSVQHVRNLLSLATIRPFMIRLDGVGAAARRSSVNDQRADSYPFSASFKSASIAPSAATSATKATSVSVNPGMVLSVVSTSAT